MLNQSCGCCTASGASMQQDDIFERICCLFHISGTGPRRAIRQHFDSWEGVVWKALEPVVAGAHHASLQHTSVPCVIGAAPVWLL
jgi:hypothetical protein